MPSIKQLLAEAEQFKTGASKLAGGSIEKTASSDAVSVFADKLISGNFDKDSQAQLEKTAAQGELYEKVAEALMVIESICDLALANTKVELTKEASVTGKTEAEIEQMLEKLAAKMNTRSIPGSVKMALGLLGMGGLGVGAGYAVGREQGRNKGHQDVKNLMATNSFGPGGV